MLPLERLAFLDAVFNQGNRGDLNIVLLLFADRQDAEPKARALVAKALLLNGLLLRG